MGQAVLLVGVLVAAGPPTPAVPSAADVRFGQRAAAVFLKLNEDHVLRPSPGSLAAAAVGGLYAAAGRPVPPGLAERAGRTDSEAAHAAILAAARAALGDHPALAGGRDYLVAVVAAGRAADPYTAPSLRSAGQPGGSDLEFGMGFELDGLNPTGIEWLAYELAGEKGPKPAPPLPLPWRVGRVLPGGPAASAGLRPGDAIDAIDGHALTPATADLAMAKLLGGRSKLDDADPTRPYQVPLTVTRAGSPKPLTFKLEAKAYTPDSVFGYRRAWDGRWSYTPDAESGLAYIRLGFVEGGSDATFREAIEQVRRDGAAGLVLDLRWCSGGFVEPCKQITAHLLAPGKVIYVERKPPTKSPIAGDLFTDGPGTWAALPLAVLISPETTGGGEMIAAALQDHKRAVTIGQRTFGRASVSLLADIRFSELRMRVTKGYSDRPDGRPRHRLPGHGVHDEWGVRPDPGCVVPVTSDLSRQLHAWADRQALRAGGERAAGPLDDPLDDPQRVLAERILRKRIAAGGP